eukprot:11197296-Lingulodinium_polyedra.AAC.2
MAISERCQGDGRTTPGRVQAGRPQVDPAAVSKRFLGEFRAMPQRFRRQNRRRSPWRPRRSRGGPPAIP